LLIYPYDTPKQNVTQTLAGLTVEDNGDGTLTLNGTTTGDAWIMFHKDSEPMTLPAGTYTISGFENLFQAGAHPWALAISGWGFYDDFKGNKTFTLAEETSSAVNLKLKSGHTFNNITIKPMLNKGTVALPYQPYGYIPVVAKAEGKNLFNPNSEHIYGCALSVASQTIIKGSTYVIFIPCKPNTTYTFSRKNNGDRLRIATMKEMLVPTLANEEYPIDNVKYYSTTNEGTYTTNSTAKYIIIDFGNGDTSYNSDIEEAQLEEGSTATPYEPYKGKIISLPLGDIELRSTPDGTRDTFERVDGVWNKVEYNPVFNFNGNESWTNQSGSMDTENTAMFTLNTTLSTDYKNRISYCNRFKYYDGKNGGSVQSKETDVEGFNFNPSAVYSNYIYFRIRKSLLPTQDIAGWKSWLASNPLEVIYPVKTPTYTPITDQALISALDELEQLILHKGYNRITVTAVNGVKAYLDLDIPATASVTNVVETDVPHELIIPAVTGEGDVKVKIPTENKMTINPATGEVNVKALKIDGVDITTFIEQVVAKLGT
jgi:hypothetical protein